MRECKVHIGSQPGGGVCSQCLQKRLTLLWRGQSFHKSRSRDNVVLLQVMAASSLSTAAVLQTSSGHGSATHAAAAAAEREGDSTGLLLPPQFHHRQTVFSAAPPSASSVARAEPMTGSSSGDHQLQPLSSSGVKAVMEEWVSLQANRRSKLGVKVKKSEEAAAAAADTCDRSSSGSKLELKLKKSEEAAADTCDRSPSGSKLGLKVKTSEEAAAGDTCDRLSSGDVKPAVDQPTAGICDLGNRSHPLVNVLANETALRVIGEEEKKQPSSLSYEEIAVFGATDYFKDLKNELYTLEDADEKDDAAAAPTDACFSPAWKGKIPKLTWVKVLINPLLSSNKVFPSKSREYFMSAKVSSSSKYKEDLVSRAAAPPQVAASAAAAAAQELKAEEGRQVKSELFIVHHRSLELPEEEEPEHIATTSAPRQSKVILNLEASFTMGAVVGIPDDIAQQEEEDMAHRMEASRKAVLSWLQDIPSPKMALFQKTGKVQVPPLPPPSSSTDSLELLLYQNNNNNSGGMELQQQSDCVKSSCSALTTDDRSRGILITKESCQDDDADSSGAIIPFGMRSFQKFLVISSHKQNNATV